LNSVTSTTLHNAQNQRTNAPTHERKKRGLAGWRAGGLAHTKKHNGAVQLVGFQ